MTPEEQQQQQQAAEQKYGGQRVQEWLSRNPGDIGRIDSAFGSDNTSRTNEPGSTSAPSSSPWGGGGAPSGTWGSSYSSSTSNAPVSSPWADPSYMRFSSQAPTNYMPYNPTGGFNPTGTGGVAGPGSTPVPGGMTKEQVIAMVDEMKTNGLKGDPNFDLYYGIGKTPQQMIDYMNTFSQYGNWSGGTPQGGQPPAAGLAPDRRNELYDMLMGRAKQGLDLDANDPIIKGQVDSYRAEQTRANRDLQSALAERGQSFGPTQQAMANERMGRDVGGFQAQLMGRELQARRDEIAQALSAGAQFLTEGDQLALQRELGLLDNQIRQQGLRISADDLALRRELGLGGLNNDLMRAMMQNQQFYSDLGYRTANSAADYDARMRGL